MVDENENSDEFEDLFEESGNQDSPTEKIPEVQEEEEQIKESG